jgi:hypothetical protein
MSDSLDSCLGIVLAWSMRGGDERKEVISSFVSLLDSRAPPALCGSPGGRKHVCDYELAVLWGAWADWVAIRAGRRAAGSGRRAFGLVCLLS